MVSVYCFMKSRSKVSMVRVNTTTGLWATDTGILLMGPGKTPEDNLRFVTFVVNTLMAVYHHNGLLKASISSATNAHRLGANEATSCNYLLFLGNSCRRYWIISKAVRKMI